MGKSRRFGRSFRPSKATAGDREENAKGWPESIEKVGEAWRSFKWY